MRNREEDAEGGATGKEEDAAERWRQMLWRPLKGAAGRHEVGFTGFSISE